MRQAFVEEFYKVPWESIHSFDLVVNTGKISTNMAITWIIDAANTFASNMEIGKPTTASIKVDQIMKEAIADTLKCNGTHR